jgi:hypothetical protein
MRPALEYTCISARIARELGTRVDALPALPEELLLVVTEGSITVVHSGTRVWLGQSYRFNAVRFTHGVHLTLECELDVSEEGRMPVPPNHRTLWVINGSNAVKRALEDD